MTPSKFCQWLSGCLDIMETKTLNTKQVEMIKDKLSTVDDHKISPSLHAKTPLNINTPQTKEIYIPIAPITTQHPDLGPYPTWQEKNPNWSGMMGQTSSVSLQTVLSPSTNNYYYEHHSDIPIGVAVSDYVGPKPNIGTYENTLPCKSNMSSYTYSNIPIKNYPVTASIGYGRYTNGFNKEF